jgi:hypothetical protein
MLRVFAKVLLGVKLGKMPSILYSIAYFVFISFKFSIAYYKHTPGILDTDFKLCLNWIFFLSVNVYIVIDQLVLRISQNEFYK